MSTNEKDYSDWVQYFSNLSNMLSLLCGFTFTASTVLLTLLPDPSQFLSQVTLFILSIATNLFILGIWWINTQVMYFLKRPPRLPTKKEERRTGFLNFVMFLSVALLGVAGFFLYILFNLIYLALVTGIVGVLFQILGYFFVWKPIVEYKREVYSQYSED